MYYCVKQKKKIFDVLTLTKRRNTSVSPKKKRKMKKANASHVRVTNEHGFSPLFGLSYNPVTVSAFGYLQLPSLDFDTSQNHTSFM